MLDSNGQRIGETPQQAVEMTADLPQDTKEPCETITDTVEQISDTLITDPKETLDILCKICETDFTADTFLQEYKVSEFSDKEGKTIFVEDGYVINDIINYFFSKLYGGKYAYIKQGNDVYCGAVRIEDGTKKELATPYGRIVVPTLSVSCANGRTIQAIFSTKALLERSEMELYSFTQNQVASNERDTLEKEIIAKLIEYAKPTTNNVVETNHLFEKIEKLCRDSGTIEKVEFRNNCLDMFFTWRKVSDTDQTENGTRILPPLMLRIDLSRRSVTSPEGNHPHRLGANDLCLGGTLTNIKDRCFAEKDLAGLVQAFIQFGNQWTSSDAQGTDRDPKKCVMFWLDDHNGIDVGALPIDFMELTIQQGVYIPSGNTRYKEYLKARLDDRDFAMEYANRTSQTMLRNLLDRLYGTQTGEEKFNALFPNQE